MYLVIIKDDYGETWRIRECATTDEVMAMVIDATKSGREVKIAEERGYSISCQIHDAPVPVPELEPKPEPEPEPILQPEVESETPTSESEVDSSSRGKSHRAARR